MIRTTVHYARTHLCQLLEEVERGQTVVIFRGDAPVARLVAVEPAAAPVRPTVGTPTTSGVGWSDDAFAPLADAELEEWGL